MNSRSLRKILLSWDIAAAAILFVAAALTSPQWPSNKLMKDLYGLGTAVLAILFSVFFAALTIIMSSSDDEFVSFLEENGEYTEIVSSFQYTLLILFTALLYSIFLYVYTSFRIESEILAQSKWWSVLFCFLSVYGLLAALESSLDSITYARYRVRFISIHQRGTNRNAKPMQVDSKIEGSPLSQGRPRP